MPNALPLVMIPGLSCTADLFAAQVANLSRDREVMIADISRHDSMAGFATAILAAAPPRFALAGLSMGGYIALEIIRRSPDRVARLCLMDSSARADTPAKTLQRNKDLAAVRAGHFLELAAQDLPQSIARCRHSDKDLAQAILKMAADTGAKVWTRQMQAIMGRVDSRPILGHINVPTLVVVGDEDQLTPPEHALEMASGIPDATLSVIGGCGHMSSMERPEEVTHLLRTWLDA